VFWYLGEDLRIFIFGGWESENQICSYSILHGQVCRSPTLSGIKLRAQRVPESHVPEIVEVSLMAGEFLWVWVKSFPRAFDNRG